MMNRNQWKQKNNREKSMKQDDFFKSIKLTQDWQGRKEKL
jgi:hypothetical protein